MLLQAAGYTLGPNLQGFGKASQGWKRPEALDGNYPRQISAGMHSMPSLKLEINW